MRGVLAVLVAVVVLAAGAVAALGRGRAARPGPRRRTRRWPARSRPRRWWRTGPRTRRRWRWAWPGHGGGGGGQPPVKVPTATGTGGAAATVDVLATDAAIDMLRKGGNAVDATVAAAGVLGVTEPFSAGIGGGGFMVIRTRHGKVTTIDGRETAPAAMTPTSFIENGTPLPFADARWSGLSAGVPGTVATWEYALERYGTKSLRKTLESGIDVARRGFPVDQTFFDQTAPNVDYFNDVPSTAAIYLDPDGTPKDVGSTLRNPDMAKAYEMIARYGAARLLPRADRAGDRRGGEQPADRADRQPHLASQPDHRGRHRPLPGDRARADAHQLQGPRRVGHGPAVERRLERRRGAEHPRGLPAARQGPHAGAAPLPRSLAPDVRRSRRLPRATQTSSRSRCSACSRSSSPPAGAR